MPWIETEDYLNSVIVFPISWETDVRANDETTASMKENLLFTFPSFTKRRSMTSACMHYWYRPSARGEGTQYPRRFRLKEFERGCGCFSLRALQVHECANWARCLGLLSVANLVNYEAFSYVWKSKKAHSLLVLFSFVEALKLSEKPLFVPQISFAEAPRTAGQNEGPRKEDWKHSIPPVPRDWSISW